MIALHKSDSAASATLYKRSHALQDGCQICDTSRFKSFEMEQNSKMLHTWCINDVDQVRFPVAGLHDQGHGSHLQGDTPLLLIYPSIGKSQGFVCKFLTIAHHVGLFHEHVHHLQVTASPGSLEGCRLQLHAVWRWSLSFLA